MKSNTELTRFKRLVDTIRLLRAQGGLSSRQLQEEFQTSSEQLFQDMQDLSSAGVSIYLTRRGFQILPPHFDAINPLQTDESVLVMQGLFELHGQGILKFDPMKRILEKLFGYDSDAGCQRVHQIRKMAFSSEMSPLEIYPAMLESIHEAIRNRSCIQVYYQFRKNALPSWHDVSPYISIYRKNQWNLIGYSHNKNGIRTYKTGKIQEIQDSEQRFVKNREFEPEDYLLNTWNNSNENNQIVVIQFDREIGPTIVKKGMVRGNMWKENGLVHAKLLADDLDDVAQWVMQYGEHAEVLEPETLRKTLAMRSARMAAKYKDTMTRVSSASSKVIQLF